MAAERTWVRTCTVTEEAVRAFCAVTGTDHPWCTDPAAARAAGYVGVVAPPMFAAAYALGAVDALQHDPRAGIAAERAVHGAQSFRWPGVPVVAGDVVETTARLGARRWHGTLELVEILTASTVAGRPVCEGVWTAAIRPEATP
jgi:acyl dehydratase